MSAQNLDLTHPRIISAAKSRGIFVHYWTINAPDDMSDLIQAGADGLITDFVDRGRAALDEYKKMGAERAHLPK